MLTTDWFCSCDRGLLDQVIKHLKTAFEITVMDPNCFVGLQIYRNRHERIMLVHQQYYIQKIIKKFELQNAKMVSSPMETNIKYCKDGIYGGTVERSIVVPYR